jgi:O-antigen biosynthesis protein
MIKDSVPKIAVVICTHNRPALLERSLRWLRQVDSLEFSVLVVDSAPNSSETKSVARRYEAEYAVSPLKGLSRARNVGIRTTRADIIVYLDDDMLPHKRWLRSLIEPFVDEDVMAVTGPMLPMELAGSSDRDLRLGVELAPWGPRRFEINRSSPQWFERANFGGVGDGNFAVRRSAFERIHEFDERLGRGGPIDGSEEHYAFFQLVDRGFKIAYCPQAIVFHATSPRTSAALRKQAVDTVAFAVFLAWHHPCQSWRVVRFLAGGIFHTRRWWRGSTSHRVISLSSKDRMGSAWEGLSTFLRSLRQTPE